MTVAVELSPTITPPGALADTEAVLTNVTASNSAWLTTLVAVQMVLAPGCSVDVGQDMPVMPGSGSATTIPDRVTLPVLVTRNE